ncbi:MAG: hypothetical protein RL263_36 [Bacteroidota bacterium]|jgi:type I restriction enzyme S subunit
MKKYDNYKDSGIEWIGEIPSNWEVKKLKFVSKIFNGDSLNEEEKERYSQEIENSIPYVSTKDIDIWTARINYENGLKIPVDHSRFKIAPKNSFLMCVEGGSAGRKFGHLQMDVFFVNKLACFETQSVNNKFLYYYAQSPLFQLQFQNSLSGLIGGVAISQIRNFSVILPIPDEQTAIANYLDKKTTQIDDLIAKKERLIQLLEEERTAVINQAVTKGLDPNVPMKDSGMEWLGEIPAHWEVKRLRNIVDSVKTGSTPPTDEIQFFSPQEINWYGPGDFENLFLGEAKRKISRLAIDQNKCRLFPSNSLLLIGIGATVGKVGLTTEPCSSNQQINAITLKKVYNPEYYLYYLSTIKEIIAAEASSSTLPIFNQTQTKNIIVSVPPIDEQNHIVRFIKNQTERIQAINSKTQQEIELLKEYKTTLISEVVTGKVDVRDWQPMNKN